MYRFAHIARRQPPRPRIAVITTEPDYRAAFEFLGQRGIHTIDVAAEHLTVATIHRYRELKKRLL